MPSDAIIAPLERWMIPDLLKLGAELMAASSYKDAFDHRYAEQLARTNIENPSFRAWLAWRKEQDQLQLCGLIMGSIHQMIFSPRRMAIEETIYVRRGTPNGGMVANELMQRLIHWAFAEQGASFLRGGETSGIAPRATEHFFKRNGFRKSGTLYQMENPK